MKKFTELEYNRFEATEEDNPMYYTNGEVEFVLIGHELMVILGLDEEGYVDEGLVKYDGNKNYLRQFTEVLVNDIKDKTKEEITEICLSLEGFEEGQF